MKQFDYFSVYIVKVYYLSIISSILNLFLYSVCFLKKKEKRIDIPF